MKIILATGNLHKVEEINAICAGFGLEFISPQGDFSPVEDGETFEENALIKAREAQKYSKTYVKI